MKPLAEHSGRATRKTVEIYTDGACSGNPGPGGWAAMLIFGEHKKEIWGSEPYTTNQRMELTAAAEALKLLKYPCRVRLHSDSAYLINAFTKGWVDRWQINGWLNSKRDPVENQDLWRQLLEQAQTHDIEWIKVKGHAENQGNNRCDELATAAIRQLETSAGKADHADHSAASQEVTEKMEDY